jgi:hypothetical protein
MQQYWPKLHRTIDEVFGTVLSENELKMVEVIRQITKGSDPQLTHELERKIRTAF